MSPGNPVGQSAAGHSRGWKTMKTNSNSKPNHARPHLQKYNTESRGEYSQTRRLRTASAVYRSSCMEILRSLADTNEHRNGVHFVRCLRATLTDEPLDFQPEVVALQLKALSVVETVAARQEGYSCRISFEEFIHRYGADRGQRTVAVLFRKFAWSSWKRVAESH